MVIPGINVVVNVVTAVVDSPELFCKLSLRARNRLLDKGIDVDGVDKVRHDGYCKRNSIECVYRSHE